MAALPVQDPDEPVVFWFSVGTLAAGIVPEFKLEALPAVNPPDVPVVFWLSVGILAASNVPDVIFDAGKFPTLAAAKVPDEILLAFKFVTDEPLPLVANLPARAFVIVVENEASSFIAAANSFKVFNAPGLESTKLAIAVSV